MTENTWLPDSHPDEETEPPPEPKTKKRRRWPWVIGVVGALFAGMTIGAAAASEPDFQADMVADDHPAILDRIAELDEVEADIAATESGLDDRRSELNSRQGELDDREEAFEAQASDVAEREDDLDTREDDLDTRESELDERADGIASDEESVAENTIPGDGVFVVGEDIEPGTYRTEGGPQCYWARLSDTSGDFDAVITNGLPAGPATVMIQGGDGAFETSGCPDWTLR